MILENDWRVLVNIEENYIEDHRETIKTLAEFRHTWDGRLDRTTMAKHRIESTEPDVHQINSNLYRAGPKAWEFKKMYIDEMVHMHIPKFRSQNGHC